MSVCVYSRIAIFCPKCGYTWTQEISQMNTERIVECGGCGHTFVIKVDVVVNKTIRYYEITEGRIDQQ